ncbi:secreted protein [Phakopsora pachyrhizi]|uniref:Secreted protein n=1 Tax=Phakopsora pachyrhizi TaxID=170000 RepID=A0AAV0ALP0_PHAPC|nr:secreted protein [Phakopsora pachyrhizi]CAH7668004.1 secreted protein [Phakopsora pachyrhizi]CAH7668019.1 secreted protein [Phakopsora pachyrhizi]
MDHSVENKKQTEPTPESQVKEVEMTEIPSALFFIPLPRPANRDSNDSKDSFLIYTFPRSVYEKPEIDPNTGKRGKEKLVKKAERLWQEEVKEANEIKRGEHPDASKWKKTKGFAARGASSVIRMMSNSAIETLGRLPPPKKLGKITIYYPSPTDIPAVLDAPQLQREEVRQKFIEMLIETRGKARKRAAISGVMLPVTLALDIMIIVPLFLFEINMAYFSLQANGARKVEALTKKTDIVNKKDHESEEKIISRTGEAVDKEFEFEPAGPHTFRLVIEHLYAICSSFDSLRFPPLADVPGLKYEPDRMMARELIDQFKSSVSEEVASRHVLDEARVAEDLHESLKKAAKQYLKTLT